MAEVDKTTVLPGPVTCRVGRFSSEMALAPRLRMRDLETISVTRRNGRGPDSSIKRLSSVHVVALWTVSDFPWLLEPLTSNIPAGEWNCQDPDRCVGLTLTVPNRRFGVHKFISFRMYKVLNLLWGPRFGGQTGSRYTSPPGPTQTSTSRPRSFRP